MNKRVKISLIAIATVAVLLVVVAAGWVATRSLDIPAPDVSDLAVERIDVPDEDNAYVYFERTVESFDWRKDESPVASILIHEQWDEAFVTELLSRNATTLALLKQGLARPVYQPREEPKLQDPKLPYHWSQDAAELLALEAMRERRAGSIDRVWQCCFDQCQLLAFTTSRPRGALEYAVSLTALGRGVDEAERLLRESHPQETELLALLGRLNRIGPLDAGMVRTIKEEFQFASEAIDSPELGRTRHSSLFSAYIFQPNRTRQMCADFFRAALPAAAQPYSQVHVPEFEPLPSSKIGRHLLPLRRNGAGRILAAMVVSADAVGRIIRGKCSTQSHLDGLRLVVACRLHEIRHGRLPEKLEDLVPEFLSEVPRDPFDGRPFRYSPETAVVYSVGEDLTDSPYSVPARLDARRPARPKRKGDDLVYAIHGKTE